MDRARNASWVARVVAWHNRHPLARRITPAQVQGTGYVDLPYSAHDAKARGQWQAVFSEDFLPPLRAKRIARWALRHGLDQTPRDVGQPVRQVPIDRSRLPPEGLALVLWVGTAAIHDAGGEQTRVLLGPTAPHAVLGRRLWSRPRLAAASLALLLVAALPTTLLLLRKPPVDDDAEPVVAQQGRSVPPAVAAALAAASAASATAATSVTATAASAAGVAAAPKTPPQAPEDAPEAAPAQHAAASAPDAAASAAATTLAVVAAPPPPTPAPFPPRRPLLDEARKIVAQQDVAAARAARAAAKGQTVYAVATQQVRTQAESELLGATLQQALVNTEAPRGLRVEALPSGRDWRAVCWPFLDRADAERVRDQLAARGQRIEIIAF